jgi:hypothetical protein
VTIAIPTVRNKLDTQFQTRTLVAELKDYPGRVAAHSRALSKLLLPDHAGEDHAPKIRAWQAALRSLTLIRQVVFPLKCDEFCFDSDQVSYGARLWANLLGLMLVHAWLEQRSREVLDLPGGERAVVATSEDYEAAYGIFEVTCERSIVNISDTHRKILNAVYRLRREGDELACGYSLRKIGDRAGVHHSTVGEHKTFLTKSAKLLREAEGGGLDLVAGAEPSWWRKDDLLVGFPRPEQVRGWSEEELSRPATESARRPRHPQDGSGDSLSSAENTVGWPSHQPLDTVRWPTMIEEASARKTAASDVSSDMKNSSAQPETDDSGPASEPSGAVKAGVTETVLSGTAEDSTVSVHDHSAEKRVTRPGIATTKRNDRPCIHEYPGGIG